MNTMPKILSGYPENVLSALVVVTWIFLAVFALRGARWAYAIFIILGFVAIPAMNGFHLHRPDCETELTFNLAWYSLGNYKHIFLFGTFFLMTWVQLRRVRHAFLLAAVATMAMGVLIELEEGATNRHCRVRDLVPDAAGAVAGSVIATVWRSRYDRPR